MTLKEIHAMFEIGQVWTAENTKIPKMNGPRKLIEKYTANLVWELPTLPRGWMPFPKARDVVEARAGYLKYRLGDAAGNTVALTRTETP